MTELNDLKAAGNKYVDLTQPQLSELLCDLADVCWAKGWDSIGDALEAIERIDPDLEADIAAGYDPRNDPLDHDYSMNE